MPAKGPQINVGRNLDLIYWGDGTATNPGLSVSQIAQHWGITKQNALEVQRRRLTEIPAEWKHKYTASIGGFRSGKTFEDIFKHVFKAIKYPQYEALIIRKHHEQLMNTYVADFKKFIARITEDHSDLLILDEGFRASSYQILVRGPSKIPAKFIFRIEPEGEFTAIRDSFKGYELGGWTMEEGSELKKDTMKVLISRMSWKGGPCHGGILSNPGFRGQWLPEYVREMEEMAFNGEKPDCLVIRSETQENAHNLPADYIEDQKRLYKNDPVGLAMALQGLDGIAEKGRPVFLNHWHDELNIDASIRYRPELPLVRGWDFGKRDAACVFWQFTKEGHCVKISEVLIKDMYVDQFVDQVINHTKVNYPGLKTGPGQPGVVDYGDFAGTHETDLGSSIQRVRDYTKGAIQIRTRYFGDIDPRINHMRKLMAVTLNGKSRLRIHPRCTMSIEGYKWGLVYKIMSDGRIADKPFNNEYMHGFDADGYAILNAMPIEEEKKSADWGKPIKAKGLIHKVRE